MPATRTRRYVALPVATLLLIVGSIVAAPPAFAYTQKTRANPWNFPGEGISHTIPWDQGGQFTITLSAGDSKHFEGKVTVDAESGFGYKVNVAVGIHCYQTATTPRYPVRGSWAGTNWLPGGGAITLQMHHLFVAPRSGTFYCRMVVKGIETGGGKHPQMTVYRTDKSSTTDPNQEYSWFRMSGGTYSDGQAWSEPTNNVYLDGDSSTSAPSSVNILNTGPSPQPPIYMATPQKPVYVWADLQVSTCRSTDYCPNTLRTDKGSTVVTRVNVMRTTTFGSLCGRNTYYPNSTGQSWPISWAKHHAILNHPMSPGGSFSVNNDYVPDCAFSYDISVRVTVPSSSGSGVWIEMSTGQVHEDGTTVPYYTSFAHALTQ